MEVELEVTEGVEKGKKFAFKEHDTFLVGRAPEAHFRFLEDDLYISRRHFLLEVNPPECYLQDLDSTNGTKVNGQKVTKCQLKDGDSIEVGYTTLCVGVKEFIYCAQCGQEIAEGRKEGEVLCAACQKKQKEAQEKAEAAVKCAKCGRPVPADEVQKGKTPVCYRCVNEEAEALIGKILGGIRLAEREPKAVEGAPRIPGYEITKCLGRGGMGAVWLAKDEKNGELVAIKTVLPKAARDERSIKLFQREMEVTAALKHPNIVRFIDRGFADAQFYFVMEYVEGIDAQQLLEQRGGQVDPREAIPIILQALDALEYAHKQNVVHRDIKPPNILLAKASNSTWNAKVNDFGLAKNFQLAGLSGITLKGQFAGSAPYMPPEQITNYRDTKPISDIFSVGATLYHLLSGQFVYNIKRPREWFLDILEDEPVPIRKRDSTMFKDLANVVDKAVSKKAGNRYQSAGQMKAALEKVWGDYYIRIT